MIALLEKDAMEVRAREDLRAKCALMARCLTNILAHRQAKAEGRVWVPLKFH